MILTDLREVLTEPHPAQPFLLKGTKINDALWLVIDLLGSNVESPTPIPTTTIAPSTDEPPLVPNLTPVTSYPNGTIVRRKFGQRYYEGEIVNYDPKEKFCKIEYCDGDTKNLMPTKSRDTVSKNKYMRAADQQN